MNSHCRAFTLIELLVVIAVIAVLMAILMPALQRAKEQGQAAACQGNLKGFTLALQMYAQEHDDGSPSRGAAISAAVSRCRAMSAIIAAGATRT